MHESPKKYPARASAPQAGGGQGGGVIDSQEPESPPLVGGTGVGPQRGLGRFFGAVGAA